MEETGGSNPPRPMFCRRSLPSAGCGAVGRIRIRERAQRSDRGSNPPRPILPLFAALGRIAPSLAKAGPKAIVAPCGGSSARALRARWATGPDFLVNGEITPLFESGNDRSEVTVVRIRPDPCSNTLTSQRPACCVARMRLLWDIGRRIRTRETSDQRERVSRCSNPPRSISHSLNPSSDRGSVSRDV
jgi:hypothetical protein